MHGGFLSAMILSTSAGLSTAIGSVLALFAKGTDKKLLSFSLGFSAGVMILVSFAELLPESRANLSLFFGKNQGGLAATLSMLLGLAIAFLIDLLVPSFEHPGPHGSPKAAVMRKGSAPAGNSSLARMGLVTALALTLHNFPEGIATFMAGYSDLRIGLPIAFSIALHNIPEGIAVSVPVFYGTGSRAKAFGISALSGLSEPLGALAAFFILAPFLSKPMLGAIFGAVAGIMMYLSFDELIPASESYGHRSLAVAGILLGVVVMWLALSVFTF